MSERTEVRSGVWIQAARILGRKNKASPALHATVLSQIWNGVLAILLSLVALFLITGVEAGLDRGACSFPATIVAMIVVFVLLLVLGWLNPRVETVYQKFLKTPADMLNRHMSIGFTTPLLMMAQSPMASGHTIGLISACFVLTGLTSVLLTYWLALPLHLAMVRLGQRRYPPRDASRRPSDTEASLGIGVFGKEMDGSETWSVICKHDFGPETAGPKTKVAMPVLSPEPDHTRPYAALVFAAQNPALILCWTLAIVVGLPLRVSSQHSEVVVDTFLLSALWLTMLALGRALKTSPRLRPWARVLLTGCANAVLWTALAMMAYAYAASAASHTPLATTLGRIRTNTTFPALVMGRATTSPASSSSLALDAGSTAHAVVSSAAPRSIESTPSSLNSKPVRRGMGAADLATAVLDAGLVSWGLKLYEHRRQLLSRAGLAVLLVSAVAAFGNVLTGPLVAHCLGVGLVGSTQKANTAASLQLAFAARSVTLALASPALDLLGGDAGINAALVVANGILFQMALGFGAGRWAARGVDLALAWFRLGNRAMTTSTSPSLRNAVTSTSEPSRPVSTPASRHHLDVVNKEPDAQRPGPTSSSPLPSRVNTVSDDVNDPRTVASGITVGVNAAAMGTAYLLEAQSPAAPYSALAMTTFGVMTVVVATISPLATWLRAQVGA